MANYDKTPHFNLKAVVIETGVQAETLRAWERRYGLPEPGRTSGGHRLYSEYDIEIIRWLTVRQEEGLRIGQAVELWISLREDGLEPLRHPEYAVPVSPPAARRHPEGASLEELRQAWISAVMTFDERRSEDILTQAFSFHAAEAVSLDLIGGAMVEIGTAWYEGRASVQQEHFASELATRKLESLIAAAPPPTRPLRILLACPPQEDHSLPALLLTYLLRRRGWDVLFLGADVPVGQLDATVSATRPNLVVLLAQQLHSAATMLDFVPVLQRLQTPLAYGGRVFRAIPQLARSLPGRYLGDSIQAAVPAIEEVLDGPAEPPKPHQISEAYQQALTAFRDRRPRLEILVRESDQELPVPIGDLQQAVFSLSGGIEDALKLGELSYLVPDLRWVAGLMANLQLPREQLGQFLESYLQAARETLPPDGQLVTEWLEELQASLAANNFLDQGA